MSKTDGILDIIGWRLDTKPRPMLYVGPSRDFVSDQFEPRLMALFDEAPRLKDRLARGKRNKKTKKYVNGVPIRLAWSGSSTSLSSDQAADVFLDEYSKMLHSKRKTGDPFVLAKARADTYADRNIAATSTPERGTVETEKDPVSGLEFWKVADPKKLECPTWARWQTGTMHHWAWKCPHCAEWFIPRYRNLRWPGWPEAISGGQARRDTWLCCPVSGCVIAESEKEKMNSPGNCVMIAPGQRIAASGEAEGEPSTDTTTISWWASGLASPFLSWGERVEEMMNAEASGEEEAIQAAINKCGELFSKASYKAAKLTDLDEKKIKGLLFRTVSPEVLRLTLGADVQGNRIVWVVRGWGAEARSWLIDCGEVWGPTRHDDVWSEFSKLLQTDYDGLPIEKALIDAGFRPDKKEAGDYHKVYDFCRHWSWVASPTKGQKTQSMPVIVRPTEVTAEGKKETYGLDLLHINTDYFKSLVHSRIWAKPGKPGSFHLPEAIIGSNVEEAEYCRQVLSEIRDDDGTWLPLYPQNHFFDAEVLATVGGYLLQVHRIPEGTLREGWQEEEAGRLSSRAMPKAEEGVLSLRERMANRASRLNQN